MTTREPPKLREAECCERCKHFIYDNVFECTLHEMQVTSKQVCDDYERETDDLSAL